MQLLSLDVGTSAIKAAVLDPTGQLLGPMARVPYPLHHPTPDAAEVDPEELWHAVTAAARQATRDFPGVMGVGLAVMTPVLALIGADGRPLGRFWTHLDRRARPAARQVNAAVGEEFLASTGSRPVPGGTTAVSFRQQLNDEPYVSHRVRHYLHVNGWLALRLTGERAMDPGNACVTGLFHTFTDHRWSPRWCDYFEVDAAWLPPVVCGSATVGTLRSAAAAELGVPAGIPLKLGTGDTSSAMLAGGMQPGDLMHTVGTTQVLATLVRGTAKPLPRLVTRLFGVGNLYLQAAHNPVGGVALDWVRQLCFREQTEDEFYSRTLPAALGHPTRVTLDPPYLGGDRLGIESHRAAFRDLTLATSREDLLAAVLEALVRRHRQALGELGPGPWRRVVLTGGAAAVVERLVEYPGATVERLEEGALRGVGRLFAG